MSKVEDIHDRPFITHLEDKSEKLYYDKKGDMVYLTIIEDNVNEEKKTTYEIPKYCHLYLNPEFKAYIDDLFTDQ